MTKRQTDKWIQIKLITSAKI